MSHACHPGFVPGYPFGPQGKDGGDPTLARHTIALQIDDPSPATAGAVLAPAVVHFLPENLHLHKTSRSHPTGSLREPDLVPSALKLGNDGEEDPVRAVVLIAVVAVAAMVRQRKLRVEVPVPEIGRPR